MRKSISCNSFFFDGYTRPLINSYGKFLRYVAINNIHISNKVRQYALRLYFDRLKMYRNINHQIEQSFAKTNPR